MPLKLFQLLTVANNVQQKRLRRVRSTNDEAAVVRNLKVGGVAFIMGIAFCKTAERFNRP